MRGRPRCARLTTIVHYCRRSIVQYNPMTDNNPNPPVAVVHEDPRELVNRLLDLETEIRGDLEELLEMISVPQSATLLMGAFPTLKLLEEADD